MKVIINGEPIEVIAHYNRLVKGCVAEAFFKSSQQLDKGAIYWTRDRDGNDLDLNSKIEFMKEIYVILGA
jgi:hypothetical protein